MPAILAVQFAFVLRQLQQWHPGIKWLHEQQVITAAISVKDVLKGMLLPSLLEALSLKSSMVSPDCCAANKFVVRKMSLL
jgi:hypothetical protein